MFRTLAPFSPTFSSIECQSESVRTQFSCVKQIQLTMSHGLRWCDNIMSVSCDIWGTGGNDRAEDNEELMSMKSYCDVMVSQ